MTPEVRNLRGDIIHETDDGERWYQFSTSTWLLIGGLILFNIGCFVNPSIIDSVFRLLDVRLWPWWYFLCLTLLIAFSIKWFFIYRNWEDYDDMDMEASKRFQRLAISVTMAMAILVLLNMTRMFHFFYHPLSQWFGYGAFSWIALFSFVVIVGVMGIVIWFFKEWIVTFWNV